MRMTRGPAGTLKDGNITSVSTRAKVGFDKGKEKYAVTELHQM